MTNNKEKGGNETFIMRRMVQVVGFGGTFSSPNTPDLSWARLCGGCRGPTGPASSPSGDLGFPPLPSSAGAQLPGDRQGDEGT